MNLETMITGVELILMIAILLCCSETVETIFAVKGLETARMQKPAKLV